ncbi:MAG: HAD family hydrolase [Alphaproteobacteria bacterium]|nr:HAD family hydrolase [Alphaproteobacteria bacterium]
MSANHKIILFDWDNTIVQSADALHDSMQTVLDSGFTLPASEIRQQYWGTSFRSGFPHLFGENWLEAKEVYHKSFQTYRESHPNGLFPFLPDATKILHQCKQQNYQMGVISNRLHEDLLYEVTQTGLQDLFFCICGSGPADADKPDMRHALYVLQKGGYADMLNDAARRKNIVMIGDSKVDMLLAKNLNITGILLGDSGQETIMQETDCLCINHLHELPSLLNILQ